MPINYKDYPPDWAETRERILQRACNRCETCKLLNRSIVDKRKRTPPTAAGWDMYYKYLKPFGKAIALRVTGFTEIVLTIAHLDHDKENWNVKDDRLKALCQKCHLAYDLIRHIDNRKYGRKHREKQYRLF